MRSFTRTSWPTRFWIGGVFDRFPLRPINSWSRTRGPLINLDLYKPTMILCTPVHAFDVLGDPVRRRILELLADGERTSGAVTEVIQREFGISQPAVSQHLKVLRESGFATVRRDGARRLYTVSAAPLRDVDAWLDRFRQFWTPPLAALATELSRGKRERRLRKARRPGT
jgi:DNA-binding transcriptional ArsR family regulator